MADKQTRQRKVGAEAAVKGRVSTNLSADPYCPRCNARPIDGQRNLTSEEQLRLRDTLREAVIAAGGAVYRCDECRAVYSFRDGHRRFLGYFPKD